MNDLYKKADKSPIETAAYLKAAISALEPIMQAAEPHSARDVHLRNVLFLLQDEVDKALNAAVYEETAQFDTCLITFEQYAEALHIMMEKLRSRYLALTVERF